MQRNRARWKKKSNEQSYKKMCQDGIQASYLFKDCKVKPMVGESENFFFT